MNTFRKGDRVKVWGVEHTVNNTNGALVFLEGAGCVHYTDVQRIDGNKFLPGDIVRYRDTTGKRIIKCAVSMSEGRAYSYVNGGWDYEEFLVLVHRPSNDFEISRELAAGRWLEAIKLYRVKYDYGLRDAKDAIDAMRERLSFVDKTAIKVGDRVKCLLDGDTGTVTAVYPEGIAAKWDKYHTDFICPENKIQLLRSPVVAIVARKVGSTYSPAANPALHASVELAVVEAERLAKKHPGVEFGTFILSHKSTAPHPTVTTVKA